MAEVEGSPFISRKEKGERKAAAGAGGARRKRRVVHAGKARIKEFEGRREATLAAVKEQEFEEPANPQPNLESPDATSAKTEEPRPPVGDCATALDLAAAQVYEVLSAFDTQQLKQSLNEDAAAYTRLLNALARVAAETLKYERIRAAAARTAGESRGIRSETLGRIEEELKLF